MAQFDEINATEYGQAFGSVRSAKSIFLWLIMLMVVIQLAAFVLVDVGGVLDPLYAVAAPAAGSQPASVPATLPASSDHAAKFYEGLFLSILPVSSYLAFGLSLLLLVSLLVAVQLSLVGRLGGAAGLVSAFFWSVVLALLLTPWPQVFAGWDLPSAMFNLNELISRAKSAKTNWTTTPVEFLTRFGYYVRFVAFPLLAILLWLMVQLKFRAAERCMAGCETPASSGPAEPA
ncbi:MAG: hypothetical protein WC869_05355 [Phycisphaerae bacterium]|jgi:hypothetical protein